MHNGFRHGFGYCALHRLVEMRSDWLVVKANARRKSNFVTIPSNFPVFDNRESVEITLLKQAF